MRLSAEGTTFFCSCQRAGASGSPDLVFGNDVGGVDQGGSDGGFVLQRLAQEGVVCFT